MKLRGCMSCLLLRDLARGVGFLDGFFKAQGKGGKVLPHTLDGGIQTGGILHSKGIRTPPRTVCSTYDADGSTGVEATHSRYFLKASPCLHGWQGFIDDLEVGR